MIVKNEEMIDIIKNIIINLKKIPEITIFKNEVTTDNKKIIARFLNDMDNYKLKFNNMKICQISNHVEIKKVAILKLLEIKLKYKSNEFFVRIDQESLKLYANIYKNEKRIMKDRLFRIEDFERIFLCIIDSIDVLDEVYNSNIKD